MPSYILTVIVLQRAVVAGSHWSAILSGRSISECFATFCSIGDTVGESLLSAFVRMCILLDLDWFC
jgi:hypothetical protein